METLQIQGQILNIFDDELILNSGLRSILVDIGPSWYSSINLELGEQVTVIGEADDEDFDAFSIIRSNGEIISIRDPQGPPPWAGKRGNDDDDWYRDDDDDDDDWYRDNDDDDFLREISGEVVNLFANEFILASNGQQILVEAGEDGTFLNLTVGEQVTVIGEADDEDFDAFSITRANGEVLRFSSERELEDEQPSLRETTHTPPQPEASEEEETVEITEANSNAILVIGDREDNHLETTNFNNVSTENGSLFFAGGGNDVIDASSTQGRMRVYGGSGDDILIAGSGNRLFGNSGDDHLLVTDGGNNLLMGGLGKDSFYLANAELPQGMNRVGDFTLGEDQIIIAGFNDLTWEDLTLQSRGNDTVISVLDQEFAHLRNLKPESLGSDDFQFLGSTNIII